jgi:hypothetical protein
MLPQLGKTLVVVVLEHDVNIQCGSLPMEREVSAHDPMLIVLSLRGGRLKEISGKRLTSSTSEPSTVP